VKIKRTVAACNINNDENLWYTLWFN